MITQILYGDSVIEASAIKSIKIIEEPEMLSTELRSATIDVTLNLNSFDEVLEHKEDVFTICWGENFRMKTALVSYRQTTKNTWDVEFGNYVKILEKHDFHGDMYTDKNARELVLEIFEAAGFSTEEIIFDEELFNNAANLTGYIPYATCREALRQVMFVIGGVASSYQGSPYIISLGASENTDVPKGRVMTGVKVEEADSAEYDCVELTTHSYKSSGEAAKVLYKESREGTSSENPVISRVVFDEPHFDYEVQLFPSSDESARYTVLESSANHIVVSWYIQKIGGRESGGTMRIMGQSYTDTTKSISGTIDGAKGENSTKIENMTLVNADNAESIIQRMLNYYSQRKSATARVVVGKHVSEEGTVTYDEDIRCGDVITIPTDYQGTYTGRVVKEQYNLNGNIIIKELTVR